MVVYVELPINTPVEPKVILPAQALATGEKVSVPLITTSCGLPVPATPFVLATHSNVEKETVLLALKIRTLVEL